MGTGGSLVLKGGRIYTMAPGDRALVEALAIRSGRVVAAGSESAIWGQVPEGTPAVDLGGRTVLPGFTDAHVHWASYAIGRRALQLEHNHTLPDVLRRVRSIAATRLPHEWITGRGWDHANWGRWPSAADLDAVAPDNPVVLTRKDGHVVWANTAALRAAGIDGNTPNPPGGELVRTNGELSGVLKENAVDLLRRAVPTPDAAERQAAMVDSWPEAWSRGITGCHDMGYPGQAALFRDLATLRDAGELGVRFVWYLSESTLDEAIALGLRTGLGDPWLRVGGLKVFLDGTLGAQTAHMLEPYENDPTNKGLPTLPPAEFEALATRARDAGLAVAAHAIGDAAVRTALDVFGGLASSGRRLRHRVEHVQLVAADDIARFAAAGVVASMQPIHQMADSVIADTHWGERTDLAYPWRSLTQAGALMVFGSDAPVESPDVVAGLHAAVTRGGWHPEQTLTVHQALRAYTLSTAVASGQDDVLGSLEKDKLADLIVVDADPHSVAPERLPDLKIEATMIDGVWVWQRPDVELAGPRSQG